MSLGDSLENVESTNLGFEIRTMETGRTLSRSPVNGHLQRGRWTLPECTPALIF